MNLSSFGRRWITLANAALGRSALGLGTASTVDTGTTTGTAPLQDVGTFTPTILGTTAAGVGTYSVQTGTYVKVGKLVFVDLTVVWSAHTGTGNILIGGLPFTVSNSTPCSINGNNLTFSNQLTASFVAGAAQARPLTHVTGGALALVAMDTAAEIRLSGTYSV